jgi:RND superfamily putative drug exporter
VSKSGKVALGQVQWSATASDEKDGHLNAVHEAMKPVRADGVQVAYNGSVYPGSRQSVSDLPELIGLIIAVIVLMVVFSAPSTPTSPTSLATASTARFVHSTPLVSQ